MGTVTAVARRAAAIPAALAAVALALPPFATATPGSDAPPADPGPPPAPTDLIPALGSILAQSDSAPAGPLGLPDLSAYAPGLLLAQTVAPAAPGGAAGPAGLAIPSLSAFTPDYLLGQNLEPAAPGAGAPAPGIGPDAEDPGTGRLAFLRRVREMYEAGQLTGALLGQVPPG